MKINISEIKRKYSSYIKDFYGNEEASFSQISSLGEETDTSLIYLVHEKYLKKMEKSPAAIIVATTKLKDKISFDNSKAYLFCDLPEVLIAFILEDYFSYEKKFEYPKNSESHIAKNTKIDPSAQIGPFCIIEENVEIDEGVVIGPNNFISNGAHIKKNASLQSYNMIGNNVELGEGVKLHSHNVIGTNAFFNEEQKGFVTCQGSVVLEENVELGSSNTVEFGLVANTIISNGTKIDNNVFIGSESVVGPHSFITAHVRIDHHVETGHHFAAGGRTTVLPHVKLTDMVQLAGLSCVERDILESGAYGGFPIQKMKDYLKTAMSLTKLVSLRKEIQSLINNE